MIIEDDVDFDSSFFEKLKGVWIDDFDILYLNGTDGVHQKPKVYNENLMRVYEMWGTIGYIISSRVYDVAVKFLEENELPADKVFSMFIQFFKVYRVRKPLIFHRPGVSDIMGIVPKNYKHLEKRG